MQASYHLVYNDCLHSREEIKRGRFAKNIAESTLYYQIKCVSLHHSKNNMTTI